MITMTLTTLGLFWGWAVPEHARMAALAAVSVTAGVRLGLRLSRPVARVLGRRRF